jgi:hypothetical protein
MISPEVIKKASNLALAVTDETKDNIWGIVGYPVKYSKRFRRMDCGCEAGSLWGTPCCHKVAFLKLCKSIPDNIKETLYD